MNFYINNKSFSGEIDLSDSIKIKSFNKIYEVFYENKTLEEIVLDHYVKDDFIIIDRNVYHLSTNIFESLLYNLFIFDALEENKNIENVLILTDLLLKKNFTKKNKLIVIGGGITQEIGGFCAHILKRGIPWLFVPTTVLSMTDSAIGSKVSINRNSKNMLGVFSSPNKIIISDYFLASLSENDILSGVGEALKLSLIGGETTFELFKESLKKKDYMNIIKLASLVKKVIIEYDEFEKCERKVLNYGHSIGHAIESTTKYFIPHGTAVMIGMYVKNILFYGDKYKEINQLILDLVDKNYFDVDFDYEEFLSHLSNDKKNEADNICFILLEEIGKTIIVYKKKEEFTVRLKEILKGLFFKLK
jgi:3-dehydroquinate synthase